MDSAFYDLTLLMAGFAMGVNDNVVMFAAALAAVTFAVLLFSVLDRDRVRRRQRLDRLANRNALSVARNSDAHPPIFRERQELGIASRMAKILPRPERLAARLSRAGLSPRPGAYVLTSALCMMGCGALLYLWGGLPPIATLLAGISVGLLLPHLVVGLLIARREAAFLKNLPEAIDVMVRGLRAGLPVTETLVAASSEAAEPVAGILRTAADFVRVGDSIEDAIEKTAAQMSVPELRFLAITLSVQKETGGNLTETLANLADILRKRRQMKLKVRAVSSEARASSMILGSLPFVMFAIIYLVNRGYVMQLFEDPRGHFLIGAGLGSIAIGIFVMSRMIRFDI